MKVLVTGAKGFLGSRLIQKMIEKKYLVVAISRSEIPNYLKDEKNISWVKFDLSDKTISFKDTINFDFWDGRKQYEFVKDMGFMSRQEGPLSGNYIDYDNIDEKLCEINIWLKYIKFGFWRPTDQTCYDIWNEHLTREEAVDIVNKLSDEFPNEYFEDFLRFHNLTKTEFWETVEEFRNKDIWQKKDNKWSLKYTLK